MDGSNCTGGGGAPVVSGTPGGGHIAPSGSITTNVLSLVPVVDNAITTSASAAGSVSSLSSLTPTGAATGGGITTGSLVSNAVVPAMGAIKLGSNAVVSTTINAAAPVALNTPQTTSIRTHGAGGQSTQVRVVMGNLMASSMIKQLENTNSVRAQITGFSTAPTRSLPNTTISVSRPSTQTTYLPRANVTAAAMAGVGMGMGMPSGQRLVTPIRASPVSASATGTVTGISTAGNFARGGSVSRNNTTPSPTVLSPGASTTWMATNPTGQVQLIRAIPHQARQRNSPSLVAVSSKVLSTTTSAVPSTATAVSPAQQTNANQGQSGGIQTVSSGSINQQQPQTYVATVLPSRQHQATLVYSSNVAASQPLAHPQPFIQTSAAGMGPRLTLATPLTAAIGVTTAARQIRPIPLGKSFSATKLNTTNISIRTPNLPQLTPAIATGVSNTSAVANGPANSPRCTTATACSNGTVLPSSNLSATRIIQLQQPPGGATQQIIGPTGRLATNVMLQPIIVNTAGGNKLGLRSPVTMAAKVQPSLTITQLGIGKIPSGSITGVGGTNSPLGTGSSNGSSNSNTSPTLTAPSNLIAGVGAQMLSAQNSVSTATSSCANSMAGSGGATIVPLAISSRPPSVGSFIAGAMAPIKNAGAMAPIKNAGAITVGKIMNQAQLTSPLESGVAGSCSSVSSGSITPNNVFIHHAAIPQRPPHCSSTSIGNLTNASNSNAVGISVPNTSAVGASTASFLPATGNAIYYESMSSNTAQASTGVLSTATPSLTSSTTISTPNHVSNNLAITPLPFSSHASIGGNASTTTFTVVPSSGGRTIGPVQIPVSNAGTHIQAIRFNQLANSSLASGAADALAVSQTAPEIIQQGCANNVEPSHIIIPATQRNNIPLTSNNCAINQYPQHMIIPLQTSIKMTAGNGGAASTAVVSNFLRKRGLDGPPVRAAKNLQPTLLSMSSTSVASLSPPGPSIGSSYSLNSRNSLNFNTTIQLTAEALAKKNRTLHSTRADNIMGNNMIGLPLIISNPCSPASSDGSTTVSANSSPGIDQQIKGNNLIMNRMPPAGGQNIETHFNPINELYLNHSVTGQYIISGVPISSRNLNPLAFSRHTSGCSIPQLLDNFGQYQCSSIKKSRRATVDNQLSITNHNHHTHQWMPPIINLSGIGIPHESTFNITAAINGTSSNSTIAHDALRSGKENTKPVEYILRRPPNCTLLSGYKQTWKAAYNHFQRYTDVKPREERKPTVMDLANQSNIAAKISGWKIIRLRSQMKDLSEHENLTHKRLVAMLHQMESDNNTIEMERIKELMKGNIQRCKIIVDGLNEAQNQIMKIFDHKAHVADIINRCASKRNFKRRIKAF